MKFKYRAKKGPHQHQDGVLEAVNYREAVNAVTAMGLTPFDVKPVSGQANEPDTAAASLKRFRQPFFNKWLKSDIALLTRYLSDFLTAGVPMLSAIGLTKKYFRDHYLMNVLAEIEESVRDGDSLSVALGKTTGVFSDMYINMIRAGEMSGTLEETLARLAEFLEKDQETRSKVFSSMIYPVIILLFGMITIFIVLTLVIPEIMKVFKDMDQQLPLITQLLMGLSTFLSRFWWLIGLSGISGFMLFSRWINTIDGRFGFDHWVCRCMGIGPFTREVSMSRFSRTLGTLLTGGVDIVPALSYSSQVVTNVYLRNEYKNLAEQVAGGSALSQAASRSPVFYETDVSMVSVGEETGALSAALLKLADFYEKDIDRKIKIITTLIEPGLILGLGLIIGFIVLAMLMPIFDMNLAIR